MSKSGDANEEETMRRPRAAGADPKVERIRCLSLDSVAVFDSQRAKVDDVVDNKLFIKNSIFFYKKISIKHNEWIK